MAGEQFIDPAVQTSLEKLIAALQGEEARLGEILATAQESVAQYQGMTAEAYAAQVEEARLVATKPVGAGSIAEATAAIREEVAALENVNQLITEQIALQGRAAEAARATAEAQGTVGAAAAPASRPGVLERLATVFQRPAAPAPATTGGPSAAERRAAEQAALVELAQRQAGAESGLNAQLQKSILLYSQSSDQLTRHGALTTDFINAASRGEVTLREFGDQVGATIGKFAGWTGAAAAVYGAYGAITELGRGAIDTATTVQQLHRTIDGLDNQQAGQAIIQLAHDTNSSMKDAGDAVFLFSRTFPNLNDAVYAAGLALRAYQLDGVSVTDQVKAQTAIHQQFGITAHGLGPIYDELAAGQREYNARITDQIPLLQRSASAVKNAGGDLRDFIELSTIALRTTQLSGSQLGTAFLRSASTFLNPATSKGQKDRQVLASLGIDPNQNYTSLITDALKKSATLSNAQRAELSLAVFGPLLGGRTAGFFTGGPSLLDEVQQKLNPQSVHGTFLEEFAKELATPSQQLKALTNNLQQFGAELGQAGLLTPLGVLVKGVNEVLTLSNGILRVWSSLPGPVKEVAGLVAGIYAARAVTQKVGLGPSVPFFGRSQATVDRAQLTAGAGAELDFYQQQYTSAARSATTQQLSLSRLEQARNEAVAAFNAGLATEEQVAAAQTAFNQQLVRTNQAAAERDALQQETVALQERNNALAAGLNRGLSAQAAAASVGIDYTLTTLARNVPVKQPVAPVPGSASADAEAAAAAERQAAASTADAAATAGAAEATAARTAATETATEAVIAETAATETSAAAQEGLALASETSAGVMSTLGGYIGRAVPWLLGIGLAVGAVEQQIQEMDAANKQVSQDLSTVPRTVSQSEALATQAGADIAKTRTSFLSYIPLVGGLLNKAAHLGEDVFKGINDQNFSDKAVAAQRLRQLAAPAGTKEVFQPSAVPPGAVDLGNGSYAYPRGGEGRPPGATVKVSTEGVYAQLIDTAQRDAKSVKDTAASREQWYANLRLLDEIARSETRKAEEGLSPQAKKLLENGLKGFLAQLQQVYDATQHAFTLKNLNPAAPFAQFKGIDAKQIAQEVQALGDRVKLYGGDSQSLGQLAIAYEYLAQRFALSRSDTNLQLVSQAQSSFIESVKKSAQDLVDQAGVATSPAERASLLEQARQIIDQAKRKLTQAQTAVARQVATLQKAYDADVAALKAAGASVVASDDAVVKGLDAHARAVGGVTGVIDSSVAAVLKATDTATNFGPGLRAAANAAKGKLDNAKKGLDLVGRANQQIFGQLDSELKTINQAQTGASDPFELTRLRRELQQARDQANPVKAAQDAEQLARDELAAARTQKDKLQALIDLANAEDQLNKAIAERAQSYYQYLASTTQDPIRQAQYQIAGANAAVQDAAAHGGTNTKSYYDALARYNDAQTSLAKAIQDRKQAYYTYLESTTRDPVKQAQIELTAATQAVANAYRTQGPDSQAFYEAKAKQNDAKNKLADAHLSQSEDNIQFQLDVNKISTQTAISEYENLLKLHNLTRAQREDLKRKIYDLQKGTSSDFSDLNLGTIKLPTPYEIRRAVLAAQTLGAGAITNYNAVTIQATDERSASAVGVVMDRYVTGTSKSIARAKGTR